MVNKYINELKAGKLSGLFFKKAFKYVWQKNLGLAERLLPLSFILRGLSQRPLALTLATTNICNARCIFCGYRYLDSLQGVMSQKIFKKAILDFVKMGGGDIGFTPVVGDPLIDTQLFERIKFCRSFPNIKKIGFYTNGILLAKINIEDLFNCGVNNITVSIGGLDPESYKQIYGVDKFNDVQGGLIELLQMNKKLSSPIKISIDLRGGESLQKINKSVFFKEISKLTPHINYQYNYYSWGGLIKQSDLSGYMKLIPLREKKRPCSMFYADGPTVLWDGKVTVCGCRELNGNSELILGNISEFSLGELWHSEKLKQLRSGFQKGKVPDLCRSCSAYNSVEILRRFYFFRQAVKNLKQSNQEG